MSTMPAIPAFQEILDPKPASTILGQRSASAQPMPRRRAPSDDSNQPGPAGRSGAPCPTQVPHRRQSPRQGRSASFEQGDACPGGYQSHYVKIVKTKSQLDKEFQDIFDNLGSYIMRHVANEAPDASAGSLREQARGQAYRDMALQQMDLEGSVVPEESNKEDPQSAVDKADRAIMCELRELKQEIVDLKDSFMFGHKRDDRDAWYAHVTVK